MMFKLIKDNALFVALGVGILLGLLEGWGVCQIILPKWFLPTSLFFMLFFTFCKINPLDLRLHRWHWYLLLFQVVVSAGLFFGVRPFSIVLAQGLMICVLQPSATAAPIIAGKLGGSIETLTSYTLLSSVATAVLVPLLFPIYNPDVQMAFVDRFLEILSHIAPMLIGPFLAAWALRLSANAYYRITHQDKTFVLSGIWAQLPFWLWVITLVSLMDKTTLSLFSCTEGWLVVTLLFVGALFTCVLQFWVGKHIGQQFPSVAHGKDYRDVLINPAIYDPDPKQVTRISAGQALGQKNTTLAIWMAQAYLNPLSSLAPAAYILWQNLFNSWQLSRAAKGHKA